MRWWIRCWKNSLPKAARQADLAKKMRGQVAIASAKMAYQIYKEIFGSDRFRKLAAQGARVQRLLWASTSTKNPDYSDVKYVEALIGPDTVNTVPLETLDAYRDHGEPKARLEQDVEEARRVLERLPELGIRIDKVTRQLEDEGVAKFNTAVRQADGDLGAKINTRSTRASIRRVKLYDWLKVGLKKELPPTEAKLFASAYAIFSGLVFISVVDILLTPVMHRILYRFHYDEDSTKTKQ